VRILKEAGAVGDSRGPELSTIDTPLNESPQAVEIIEAAAGGKVRDMYRFGGNPDLFCCDYDSRTALHLAASNGHMKIVQFLLEKMEHSEYMRDTLRAFQAKVAKDKKGNEEEESSETDLARIEEEERIVKINTKLGIINYKDRFYNTATMDAKREGHPEIYAELNKWNDELRAELISLGGRCFLAMGTDLFEGDYDGRTPIHIAGSDGEVDAAKFLLKVADGDLAKTSPKDRWGGTPLGDAERGLHRNPGNLKFEECVKLFKEAGAESDSRGLGFATIDEPLNEDPEAGDIIEAAAAGKVQAMVRFSGSPALYCCDYDSRTALHLAASEGHLGIVRWLLNRLEEEVKEEDQLERVKTKLGILNYKDRFFATPLMDAYRENHDDCAQELTRWTNELNAELIALGGTPEETTPAPAPAQAAAAAPVQEAPPAVETAAEEAAAAEEAPTAEDAPTENTEQAEDLDDVLTEELSP